MNWLGLDIGGANLKAADGRGWARSVPFALWRHPQELVRVLSQLVDEAPTSERFAVTMTGELCDCFNSKAQGVEHILSSVESVVKNREVRVYLNDGRFAKIIEARESPRLAAASNWHALARFACRFVTGRTGLLIDVGSTTTDIIPLVDGQVAARGRNDTERLLSQELLYRGVFRTPICALTDVLPIGGEQCPIAAEVFATVADAYVISGELAEDPNAGERTADNRPLTKEFARQRLARQLCADADDLMPDDLAQITQTIRETQLSSLVRSIDRVTSRMPEPPRTCVLSGSGEFLADAALKRLLPACAAISLADKLGVEASQCAPAHAVAVLAAEAGPGN